jgi:tetratricopeptide (TPR) repeat protein
MSEGAWDRAWEIQQRIEEQLSEMGRSSKAEKKYHLAIRYMLARRHLDEGRPRDAISILRRLVRVDPSFVPAHLRLGKALLAIGQPESAVEAWDEGYQSTGHPILLTTIEDHYLKEEQPRRAIETLKAAVWKSKKDILPRYFLGKLYLRLEMLDEALAEFTRMKSRVAYFPALHYNLAKILERHGNYREAIREMETLLMQAEALRVEYACATCSRRYPSWAEHCDRCGEWNTIAVDFREERGVEELGLSTAPVYTVDGQES